MPIKRRDIYGCTLVMIACFILLPEKPSTLLAALMALLGLYMVGREDA